MTGSFDSSTFKFSCSSTVHIFKSHAINKLPVTPSCISHQDSPTRVIRASRSCRREDLVYREYAEASDPFVGYSVNAMSGLARWTWSCNCCCERRRRGINIGISGTQNKARGGSSACVGWKGCELRPGLCKSETRWLRYAALDRVVRWKSILEKWKRVATKARSHRLGWWGDSFLQLGHSFLRSVPEMRTLHSGCVEKHSESGLREGRLQQRRYFHDLQLRSPWQL